MKKVLITGANSYIGQSVENWLLNSNEKFQVDTLDMLNPEWEKYDFSRYDSVFHVAGIAHFSKDESKKALYYKVNTELTEKTAKKAKDSGVKQFIFMSSIIVYGDSGIASRMITADTKPSPSDFYGESKWQAEKRLTKLNDDKFLVAIIRPPMIYGEGSKGNYPRLSKLAQRLPIIPNYINERSMLYIGNFCEFVKQLLLTESSGVFFPQNEEYVSTSNMMSSIAKVHHKNQYSTKLFNPIIKKMFFNDNIKKMFGNLTYEKSLSKYDFEYQIYDFNLSIKLTERMNND
ncbi:NAD-dependent epimerase/dehydratase family protein [Streptococcus uberis]|uniref:NAD-dependent epimerase/dehydratase family protein n=1 Tax=Streptococcus uberis TaxID=1349 RepID=UPI00062045F6|nr:NAD-dependent epimerase/dehydratase family protein [Streptococcus uberis]KKF49214.1 NAD-dependent epimerase [Streptococcus uberis C8329]KKF60084.1 NAD-dependent epimerase [Streptococcus uberis B362]MCK1164582.1 sugar nucleotide-binding protein [Streptococcus uberis]MCK1252569.1 sugar nucleotide-binding protein [Streptococcus uberis]